MLNTLSSRATFYDIIGYLIPGIIAIAIIWLYWFVYIDELSAKSLIKVLLNYSILSSLAIISIGFVMGHLVNSISSLFLEKLVLKGTFNSAKQWYDRIDDDCRKELISKIAKEEYNLEPKSLTSFDLRIQMEERMPNSTITGFSFLSFYGMSRSLALLSWLSMPPSIYIIVDKYSGDKVKLTTFFSILFFIIVGFCFCYQYIRFTKYYYDFLCSTLIFSSKIRNK